MSDFSDRPLVAGSLIGVREFEIRKGNLVGPLYAQPFTAGENLAACHPAYDMLGLAGRRWPIDQARRGIFPPHSIATLWCSCGFYAYFDRGPNSYRREGTVTGLIEGYGVCTVGGRGFRAEKARLVALVDPTLDKPGSPAHDRWDAWADFWERASGLLVGILFMGTWILTMLATWAFGTSIVLGITVATPALFGWAALISGMSAAFHGIKRKYPSIHPELTCSDRRYGRGLTDLDQSYAGVPRYASLDSALDAHPMTPPKHEKAASHA